MRISRKMRLLVSEILTIAMVVSLFPAPALAEILDEAGLVDDAQSALVAVDDESAVGEEDVAEEVDDTEEEAPLQLVSDVQSIGVDAVNASPVAQIGEAGYATLQAAIDAVGDGETKTIQLVDNITVTDTSAFTIPAGRTITLDLNGKTVELDTTDENNTSRFNVNGIFTIDDSSADGNGMVKHEACQYCVYVNGGGKFTLRKGTLRAGDSPIRIDNEGLATVEGGRAVATDENYTGGITVRAGGEANVTGGEIDSDHGNAIYVYANGTVSISGGTLRGGNWDAYSGAVYASTPNDVTITITGGTFNTDPTPYLAEGYEANLDNGTGLYVVTSATTPAATAVAKIGDDEYLSLEAAVAAATTGATIELLDDITVTASSGIAINETITLDLKGHNVAGSDSCNYVLTVDNSAAFTLTDTSGTPGSVSFDKQGCEAIHVYAGGTLTVNEVTIYGAGAGIYNEGGTVNIASGTVSGGQKAINNSSGTTSISDGIINGPIDKQSGTVTITGGSFDADPRTVHGAVDPTQYHVVMSDGRYVVEQGSITVAKIADEEYPSLQAALDAAVDGDTIQLVDDVVVANDDYIQTSTDAKSITIDLNGHGISGNVSVAPFRVRASVNLTLTDSTAGTDGYTSGGVISNAKADTSSYGVVVVSGAQLTVLGGLVEGIANSGTTTIENGKVSEIGITNSGGTLSVEGGIVETDGNTAGAIICSGTSTTTVSGGVVVNKEATGLAVSVTDEKQNVTVVGGRFSSDPSAYVDLESYNVTEDGGFYVVAPKDPVVKIGDVEYVTLAAAIEAAEPTDTINVVADTSYAGISIVTGDTVTVDVAEMAPDTSTTPPTIVSVQTVTIHRGDTSTDYYVVSKSGSSAAKAIAPESITIDSTNITNASGKTLEDFVEADYVTTVLANAVAATAGVDVTNITGMALSLAITPETSSENANVTRIMNRGGVAFEVHPTATLALSEEGTATPFTIQNEQLKEGAEFEFGLALGDDFKNKQVTLNHFTNATSRGVKIGEFTTDANGNVSGVTLSSFSEVTAKISKPLVATLEETVTTYNGIDQTPSFSSVTYGGEEIPEATEEAPDGYTVTWAKGEDEVDELVDAGTYTGTVTYEGETAAVTFVVKKASISDLQAVIADQTYTGWEVVPVAEDFSFFDASGDPVELTLGTDFKITVHQYDINVGEAALAVSGLGNWLGSNSANYNILARDLDDSAVDVVLENDTLFVGVDDPLTPTIEKITLTTGEGEATKTYTLKDTDYIAEQYATYDSQSGEYTPLDEAPTEPGYYYLKVEAGDSGNFTGETYAKYRIAVPVTVSFVDDDGTTELFDPLTIASGDNAIKPVDPEREGSIFLGWLAPESTTYFDFDNTPVDADLTLTASWIAEEDVVAVTFIDSDNDGELELLSYYASLEDAVEAAPTGATIKLVKDAESQENYVEFPLDKELTLDLNNTTYTGSLDVYGKLTVTDESADKGGTIVAKRQGVYVNRDGGDFTLEEGTIQVASERYGVIVQGKDPESLTSTPAVANLKGGRIESTDADNTKCGVNNGGGLQLGEVEIDVAGIGLVNTGTASIYDGCSIEADNDAIWNTGTLEMMGGTVSSERYALDNSGTFEMNNGSLEGADSGIYAHGDSLTNINGGSVTCADGFAICTNGTGDATNANHSFNAVVNIGTMTRDPEDYPTISSTTEAAIYIPAGTFNIGGGTITGSTGIFMRGGTLNIPEDSVAVINGTGADNNPAYDPSTGDGANSTGDAVSIVASGYPAGLSSDKVTIAGGTFNSENGEPIASYAQRDTLTPIEEFVSGGVFNKDLADEIVVSGKTAIVDPENEDQYIIGDLALTFDPVTFTGVVGNTATIGFVETGSTATFDITVETNGTTAEADDFEWASEDETVATVDEDGVITFLADGTVNITATYHGKTETYAVTVAKAVASVTHTEGEGAGAVETVTYFAGLADAVEAAVSGDLITMLEDENLSESGEGSVVIPRGKTLTLDLNGKTVKSTNGSALLGNNGTLTIADSSDPDTGKITNQDQYCSDVIRNSGNLIVTGGTIESNTTHYCDAIYNQGDNATILVSGGTIIGGMSGAIYSGSGTAVEVTGGTITCNDSAAGVEGVIRFYGRSATISGGHISGGGAGIYVGRGDVTIGEAACAGYATTTHVHPTITGTTYGIMAGAGTLTIHCGTITGGSDEDNAAVKIATGVTATADGGFYSDNNDTTSKILTTDQDFIAVEDPENYYRIHSVVAKIEETGETYETLAEAFAAAKTAGVEARTITLLTNVTVTAPIEAITTDVTFDMNEHELTYATAATSRNDYVALFTIGENGDFTITGNGTINGPANGENYDGKVLIAVDSNGKLAYENGTMNTTGSGSDGMYGVYILLGGEAVFGKPGEAGDPGTGPTINSFFAAIGTNNTTAPATITIYGGEYTANANPDPNDTGSPAGWAYFCAPIYAAANGTYNIECGTFKGYYGISSRYADTDQDINLGNVSLVASSGTAVFVDNKTGSTNSPDRHIQATNDLRTLSEGYTWKKIDDDLYEVAEVVCQVVHTFTEEGHTYTITTPFASLADAAAAIEDGDTITVLKSHETDELVKLSNSATLDLNGKMVKYTGTQYSGFITLQNENTQIKLTIEDSTETNGVAAGTINAGPGRAVNLVKKADFELVSGNITSERPETMSGNTSLINCMDTGTVTISGGTLDCGDYYALYTIAEGSTFHVNINITGGILTGYKHAMHNLTSASYVSISGGYLKSKTNNVDLNPDGNFDGTISGGFFAHEVKPEWCADGFVMVPNKDEATMGTYPWTVIPETDAVAKLTHGDVVTYYTTLVDAVAAAADSGDTIQMLSDEAFDSYVTIAKDVTIDLNGKTLSRTTGTALLNPNGAKVTIDDTTENKQGKVDAVIPVYLSVDSVSQQCAELVLDAGLLVSGVEDACAIYSAGANTITLNGGTVEATKGTGVALMNGGATLVIDGAEVFGRNVAITTNGLNTTGSTITIEDGSVFSEGLAIYQPAADTLTVNGGTITGATAIYAKAGTVEVTGGEIHATGDAAPYSYDGSGANLTGDAIVLDSCGYPAAESAAPTATISGGVIKSDKALSVQTYLYNVTDEATIAITGGYFSDNNGNNFDIPSGKWLEKVTEEGPYKDLFYTLRPSLKAFTATAESKYFNNQEQEAEPTFTPKVAPAQGEDAPTVDDGEYTLAYYYDKDCTTSATPIYGGLYYVVASGAEGSEFEGTSTDPFEFRITANINDEGFEAGLADEEEVLVYDKTAKEPLIKLIQIVDEHTVEFVEGRDFSVIYFDNVQAGEAAAFVVGINGFTGAQIVKFEIQPAEIVSVSDPGSRPYTGEPIEPTLTVTASADEGESSWDLEANEYSVTYVNNVNVGTASAIVTPNKNYTPTSIKQNFQISGVDKSALEAAIAAAKAKLEDVTIIESEDEIEDLADGTKYALDDEKYEAISDALDAALAVYDDTTATKTEVDTATAALTEATEAFTYEIKGVPVEDAVARAQRAAGTDEWIYFASLEDAVDYAVEKESNWVFLLKDAAPEEKIVIDRSEAEDGAILAIVLDGHKLTLAEDEAITVTGGIVRIAEGTIETTGDYPFVATGKGAELILDVETVDASSSILWAKDGGTIDVASGTLSSKGNKPAAKATGSSDDTASEIVVGGTIVGLKNSAAQAKDGGKVCVIDGGQLLSNGMNNSNPAALAGNNGTIEIDGGYVKNAEGYALEASGNGQIVLSDGKAEGDDGIQLDEAATLAVSGGEIRTAEGGTAIYASGSAKATVTDAKAIVGTLVGDTASNITVSGGWFSEKVPAEYVAEGQYATDELDYAPTPDAKFTVAYPASLRTAYIEPIPAQTYIGDPIELDEDLIVVRLDGYDQPLVKDRDFTVEYKNNTNAGLATLIVHGTGGFSGIAATQFAINEKDNSSLVVAPIDSVMYDGTAQTPAVTVTDIRDAEDETDDITLDESDYDVRYINNVEAGTATVVIFLKGNYEGGLTTTFQINAAVAQNTNTGTYYDSLSKAVEKASAEDIIKLLADTTDHFEVDKHLTIDLGSNTLTVDADQGIKVLEGEDTDPAEVVIRNGSIVAAELEPTPGIEEENVIEDMICVDGGNLFLSEVNATNDFGTVLRVANGYASVSDGSALTGNADGRITVVVSGETSEVEISGKSEVYATGGITEPDAYPPVALCATDGGHAIVEDSLLWNTNYGSILDAQAVEAVNGGVVDLIDARAYSGNFANIEDEEGVFASTGAALLASDDGIINVDGGTYVGRLVAVGFGMDESSQTQININDGNFYGALLETKDDVIVVSGGWFDNKVADSYVAEGLYATDALDDAPNPNVPYTVDEISIADTPEVNTDLVYNGEEQVGIEAGEGYALYNGEDAYDGAAAETNAGEYTTTVKLLPGYVWAEDAWDETNEVADDGTVVLTWSIDPEQAVVVVEDIEVTYGDEIPASAFVAEAVGLYGDDTVEIGTPTTEYTAGDDANYYEDAVTLDVESPQGNYALTVMPGDLYVQPRDIAELTIAAIGSQPYTGEAIEPKLTINDPNILVDGNAKKLKLGTDYTVEYANNENVGIARVTVTGIGNYTGSSVAYFSIIGDESALSVAVKGDALVFNGQHQVPATDDIVVMYAGKRLATTDYDLEFEDAAIDAGEHNIYVTGKGAYSGYATGIYTIEPLDISDPKVTIVAGAVDADTGKYYQDYTGEPREILSASFDNGTQEGYALTAVDYAATYYNNVNVGNALAIIAGKGNFKGFTTVEFEIVAPDKSELESKIDEVEDALDEIYISDNEGFDLDPETQYADSEAWDEILGAIDAAKDVLDNENSTAEEIAQALEDLQDAYEDFQGAVNTAEQGVVENSYSGMRYTSLADAVAEANDGDVLTMLEDDTIDEPVVIEKSLVLDLNDHYIMALGMDDCPVLHVSGEDTELVIIDTSDDAEGMLWGAGTAPAIEVSDGAEVDIYAGCYVSGDEESPAITVDDAKLYISDGYFETGIAVNADEYDEGDVVINGGEFVNFDPSDNDAITEHTNFVPEPYTGRQDPEDEDVWMVVEKFYVEVPEGQTLTYNGAAQTGVAEDDTDPARYTLVNNTDTTVGDKTATATLTDPKNYIWANVIDEDEDEYEYFEGAEIDVPWSIVKASVADATIELIDEAQETGEPIEFVKAIKLGNNTLPETDYAITYVNNTEAGTAIAIIQGKNNLEGMTVTTYEILAKADKDALQEKVDEAGELEDTLENVTTYDDPTEIPEDAEGVFVSADAMDDLADAIEAAQRVLDDPDATQQQIADATQALEDAIDAVEDSIVDQRNFDDLQDAIDDAEELSDDMVVSEDGLYDQDGNRLPAGTEYVTPDDKEALDEAIEDAQNALDALKDDLSATQEDIEAAEKALADAVKAAEDAKQNADHWERIWGENGYDTMQAIVNTEGVFTADNTDTVVIASRASWEDPMAATALAGIYDAPLLLVGKVKEGLPTQTKEELERLQPKRVIVVGDTDVVSKATFNAIKDAAGIGNVTRIVGKNYLERANNIYNSTTNWKDNTVIIATHNSFADTLSVAPFAYAQEYPILYVGDRKSKTEGGVLDKSTISLLKSRGVSKAIIVGGELSVSPRVVSQLSGIEVERWFGENALDTSGVIATHAINDYGMTIEHLSVARSNNSYVDALTGAALTGRLNSVLVLANSTKSLEEGTAAFNVVKDLLPGKLVHGHVYGGEVSITEEFYNYFHQYQ